jgi:hypothetical protein
VDAKLAAKAWIDVWERGWPTREAELIASRYGPGAPYVSHPFRDPTTALEYVRRAFDEEDLVRCWFGEPVATGDRAAVEYWAILRRPNGSEFTIAGTAVLRFDADGLVQDHRDYWTQREGVAEPPSSWGR